jgi:hypothetical protein
VKGAYRVTVELILDVDSDAEAYDAVNEILREHTRNFAPQSCLIDYATRDPRNDSAIELAEYCEGDAFATPTG